MLDPLLQREYWPECKSSCRLLQKHYGNLSTVMCVPSWNMFQTPNELVYVSPGITSAALQVQMCGH